MKVSFTFQTKHSFCDISGLNGEKRWSNWCSKSHKNYSFEDLASSMFTSVCYKCGRFNQSDGP